MLTRLVLSGTEPDQEGTALPLVDEHLPVEQVQGLGVPVDGVEGRVGGRATSPARRA